MLAEYERTNLRNWAPRVMMEQYLRRIINMFPREEQAQLEPKWITPKKPIFDKPRARIMLDWTLEFPIPWGETVKVYKVNGKVCV